jgi:hypothetical protein
MKNIYFTSANNILKFQEYKEDIFNIINIRFKIPRDSYVNLEPTEAIFIIFSSIKLVQHFINRLILSTGLIHIVRGRHGEGLKRIGQRCISSIFYDSYSYTGLQDEINDNQTRIRGDNYTDLDRECQGVYLTHEQHRLVRDVDNYSSNAVNIINSSSTLTKGYKYYTLTVRLRVDRRLSYNELI